jgi:hypothetical protein
MVRSRNSARFFSPSCPFDVPLASHEPCVNTTSRRREDLNFGAEHRSLVAAQNCGVIREALVESTDFDGQEEEPTDNHRALC